MSGYRVATVEFSSDREATAHEWPENIAEQVRVQNTHGQYVSAVLSKPVQAGWWEEFAEFYCDRSEVGTRLALCQCNDTTDSGEMALYERRHDGAEEIAHVGDSELSSRRDGTYCKPCREYLQNEYGFDAWSIWEFWDEERR